MDRQFVETGALRLEVGADGEAAQIRAAGELDMSSVVALEREFERLAGTNGHAIVLDLSEITFVDSTGLECLIRIARRSEDLGGRLEMRPPQQEDVVYVFELTGIERVLPIADPESAHAHTRDPELN